MTAERPTTYTPIGVADGVRTSARWAPRKICLQHDRQTITYRQLVDRMDRVGNAAVHGMGLRRGDHVAIMSPNAIDFVTVVLGLASVGVATAMVNTRSTAGELAYICDDAEARVLFVHPTVAEVARDASLASVERIVELGEELDRWVGDARPGAPRAGLEEWETFSIPYTAGTTGTPKGVLLPHRSRALTFFAMGIEYGCYGPRDRALAIAPMFHGAGLAFSVAPIFFGGFCALHDSFDPERVLADIDELAITNVFLVPTHFSGIFALGAESLKQRRHDALTTIISNAAPLPQAMKERIVEYFGDDVLFEAYGSTEAGIVSNLRPPDQLVKERCVGLPFPCTEVRLLDEQGEEVDAGEVGELHSRSPYLFNGYWKRPADTDRAMRDGWCTAGDLAQRDEDGFLYIVDRKNDKIITGGVNVYPREVEEVLARHEVVAEAAVYGVPDDYWGEAVHATVVLRRDATASVDELVRACQAQLAGYKVPKEITFVDRLPRNAAGKVLRRELRDVAARRAPP